MTTGKKRERKEAQYPGPHRQLLQLFKNAPGRLDTDRVRIAFVCQHHDAKVFFLERRLRSCQIHQWSPFYAPMRLSLRGAGGFTSTAGSAANATLLSLPLMIESAFSGQFSISQPNPLVHIANTPVARLRKRNALLERFLLNVAGIHVGLNPAGHINNAGFHAIGFGVKLSRRNVYGLPFAIAPGIIFFVRSAEP